MARQGATLVTGWWGLFAFLFYNPFAILLNFYGLGAAPLEADQLGAISLADVQSARDEDENFEELYASLPTWLTSLDEDELELVLTEMDYYALLEVRQDASDDELKTAYRRQAKRYHPDAGGAESDSELVAEVIVAGRVLTDPRLRYAYDHASEVLKSADPIDGSTSHARPQAAHNTAWECRYCGIWIEDPARCMDHLDRHHSEVSAVDPMVAFDEVQRAPNG